MRYSINFYRGKFFSLDGFKYEIKSLMLLSEVAKRLKVKPEELAQAFRDWGRLDYPQEFFLVLEVGETQRGTLKETGIHIWNWQGGGPMDKGPPNFMGVVSYSRTWGMGYQTIDARRDEFYLGAIA